MKICFVRYRLHYYDNLHAIHNFLPRVNNCLIICLFTWFSMSLSRIGAKTLSSCLMCSDSSGSLSILFWRPLNWSSLGFSSWHWLPYVLVHLSCNKIPQTGWLRKQQKFIVHSSGVWESKIRCQHGRVQVRFLFQVSFFYYVNIQSFSLYPWPFGPSCLLPSKLVVLSKAVSLPRGHLVMSEDTFGTLWVVTTGIATGIYWLEHGCC